MTIIEAYLSQFDELHGIEALILQGVLIYPLILKGEISKFYGGKSRIF